MFGKLYKPTPLEFMCLNAGNGTMTYDNGLVISAEYNPSATITFYGMPCQPVSTVEIGYIAHVPISGTTVFFGYYNQPNNTLLLYCIEYDTTRSIRKCTNFSTTFQSYTSTWNHVHTSPYCIKMIKNQSGLEIYHSYDRDLWVNAFPTTIPQSFWNYSPTHIGVGVVATGNTALWSVQITPKPFVKIIHWLLYA